MEATGSKKKKTTKYIIKVVIVSHQPEYNYRVNDIGNILALSVHFFNSISEKGKKIKQ